MGAKDPRKDSTGAIDHRIQRQLRAWSKDDPAPSRVKPIPISILHHVLAAAFGPLGTPTLQAQADMCVIAWFYLCRPGEYTGTSIGDSAPFRLQDVQLFCGTSRLDILSAPDNLLHSSTGSTLTFDNQKNGVRGECIAHGCSGSSLCCPVRALTRRVLYLRAHHAPPETPLATLFLPHVVPIKSADITLLLRAAVVDLGPLRLGLVPNDIEARSLRAGGAQALLCAGVDETAIRLVGRWRSDAALRYLHVQALPLMSVYAGQMLHGGQYTVTPGNSVPLP